MHIVLALLVQAAAAPDAEYRERMDKILRNAAAKHFAVAESLTTARMHQWARERYARVLDLDPDHEGARRRLGYRKGDAGWEVDPAAKIESANLKKDADAERIRKSTEDKLAQAGRDLGRQWAELAAWCRKSMMAKEAGDAYRRCLEFDPDHAGARKELGYEKQPDGGWMSKAQREFRAEMRDGLSKVEGGIGVQGESPFESIVGPTRKREGRQVVVEATHLKDEAMAELIRRTDHAAAMFRKAFGPVGLGEGRKLRLLVLKDQGQHERFVRSFQKPGPQLNQALKSRASGGGGAAEIWQGDAPDLLIYDWGVHLMVQALLQTWTGTKHCWLYEGIGLHFTRLMQDTAMVHCVDLGNTRGENAGKRYDQPKEWPVVCKVWVREGKDPDVNAILKCTSFAELDGAEAVKGWSLTDFLMSEHPEGFKRYIEALAVLDVEEALKKAFGWTPAELDQRWKDYVRTNY